MRWLVVCISVLGIASTSLLGAVPANAGTSGTSKHFEPGNSSCATSGIRNRARFEHDTDNVLSVDDCADGWGSNAEILITDTGRREVCYNGGGNGTTKTCNYNFSENMFGVILASSVDGGTFKGSGDVVAIIT